MKIYTQILVVKVMMNVYSTGTHQLLNRHHLTNVFQALVYALQKTHNISEVEAKHSLLKLSGDIRTSIKRTN